MNQMPVRYTPEQRYQRAKSLGILVDEEDEWLLSTYTWRISTGGYVSTMMHWPTFQKDVYLHHAIMGMPWATTDCIDHISRNKLDDRRSNLRWATYTENKLNSNRSDNAVGAYLKPNGKYQTVVVRDNVKHELGTYDTIEEATHVRNTWLAENGKLPHSNAG
jgi:hypothetical protein